MKEIKAYVSRCRTAAVIAALETAESWNAAESGDRGFAAFSIEGALIPLDGSSTSFSLECGNVALSESRLELHCEDAHLGTLLQRIRDAAATEALTSEWIYLGKIVRAVPM